MKPLLTAIAAAVFLLLPISSFADYIIHLKDGTKFVTDQYFEEGDQIRFKRYGGLIGVEKDRIREIEETQDLPEPKPSPKETEAPLEKDKERKEELSKDQQKEVATHQAGERKDQKSKEKGYETEGKKAQEVIDKGDKKSEEEEDDRISALLEEKRRLNNEMKRVYLGFKKARDSDNKEARRQLLVEFDLLRQKLDQLEEQVKSTYGGKLPDWWTEDRLNS